MRIDIDDAAERIRLKMVEWAKLDGEARLLEEMLKPVFSEMVNQEEGPVSAREHTARASKRYIDHVKRMVSARTTANVARAEVDGLKLQWETWRTRNATKRAEMGLR